MTILNWLIRIFLLLITYNLAAQIQINGWAKGAEGKNIQLITYSDYITFEEQILFNTLIDDSAQFEMVLPNWNNTKPAMLRIDKSISFLFLEPQTNYTLRIIEYDYDTLNQQTNTFIEPFQLQIQIQSNRNQDINKDIRMLDSVFSNFLIANEINLVTKNTRGLLIDFQKIIKETFPNPKNKYFETIIKYRTSIIELFHIQKDSPDFIAKYCIDDSIYYDNIEFMGFFNEYYDNYLKNLLIENNKEDKYLRIAINDSASLAMLEELFIGKVINNNNDLKELVLLKSLNDMFHNNGYNPKNLMDIVFEIAIKSKSFENKLIAKNIILRHANSAKYFKSPDYFLLNQSDSGFNSKDQADKYKLICFWNTSCPACISEFSIMKRLHENYSDSLQIICISTDEYALNMKYFLQKNKYPFDFLYLNRNNELLNHLKVNTLPYFVFLDKKSYIISNPATKPSENLEVMIYETIFNEKWKEKRP